MTDPRVFSRAPELVEHLLDGGSLSAAELEIVLKKFAAESQWHDYKSGRIADDVDPKPGRRLRHLVASFGNSEGGVVFIGVGTTGAGVKRRLVIDGYQGRNGQTWQEWVSNELQHDWSRYSPTPRTGEILVPGKRGGGKTVVWIAVAHQDNYVQINGEIWFRLPDGSKKAPEYLIGDIVLGRRRRPQILVVPEAQVIEVPGESDTFPISVRLSNVGLVGTRVRLGFVYYSDQPAKPEVTIPQGLMPFLDVRPTTRRRSGHGPPRLAHHVSSESGISLPVFEEVVHSLRHYRPSSSPWVSRAALYVLPDNHPPTWHQVTLNADKMGERLRARFPDVHYYSASVARIEIVPCALPVVEWTEA